MKEKYAVESTHKNAKFAIKKGDKYAEFFIKKRKTVGGDRFMPRKRTHCSGR